MRFKSDAGGVDRCLGAVLRLETLTSFDTIVSVVVVASSPPLGHQRVQCGSSVTSECASAAKAPTMGPSRLHHSLPNIISDALRECVIRGVGDAWSWRGRDGDCGHGDLLWSGRWRFCCWSNLVAFL